MQGGANGEIESRKTCHCSTPGAGNNLKMQWQDKRKAAKDGQRYQKSSWDKRQHLKRNIAKSVTKMIMGIEILMKTDGIYINNPLNWEPGYVNY